MTARSSCQHLGIVGVLWGQSCGKLAIVQPPIPVFIVPLEEKVNIVLSNMHSYIGKSMLHIKGCDCSQVVDVEHSKGVVGVEVRPRHRVVFNHLDTLVKVHLFTDHSYHASFSLLSDRRIETASDEG